MDKTSQVEELKLNFWFRWKVLENKEIDYQYSVRLICLGNLILQFEGDFREEYTFLYLNMSLDQLSLKSYAQKHQILSITNSLKIQLLVHRGKNLIIQLFGIRYQNFSEGRCLLASSYQSKGNKIQKNNKLKKLTSMDTSSSFIKFARSLIF